MRRLKCKPCGQKADREQAEYRAKIQAERDVEFARFVRIAEAERALYLESGYGDPDFDLRVLIL
jgi:hypothetical protein